MQGKEFVSDDWTRETVTSTIAIMAAEVGEADAKGFNAGPIKDGTDWPQWESDYFVELCGVKGTFTKAVGLAPFARDDSRKDDLDLTEIEREVFSIRLEGPEYDRGNPIFFPKQGQGYLSRGDHCAVCFCSGREECVPGHQGSPEWGRSSPQEDCGCQACY